MTRAKVEIIAALREIQEDLDLRNSELIEHTIDALREIAPLVYATRLRVIIEAAKSES